MSKTSTIPIYKEDRPYLEQMPGDTLADKMHFVINYHRDKMETKQQPAPLIESTSASVLPDTKNEQNTTAQQPAPPVNTEQTTFMWLHFTPKIGVQNALCKTFEMTPQQLFDPENGKKWDNLLNEACMFLIENQEVYINWKEKQKNTKWMKF